MLICPYYYDLIIPSPTSPPYTSFHLLPLPKTTSTLTSVQYQFIHPVFFVLYFLFSKIPSPFFLEDFESHLDTHVRDYPASIQSKR